MSNGGDQLVFKNRFVLLVKTKLAKTIKWWVTNLLTYYSNKLIFIYHTHMAELWIACCKENSSES